MNSPIEFIKAHPVGIAISIFIVGILYLLLRGSGQSNVTATTSTGATPDEVQAATQLQLAQIQSSQAINQTNAQAQVASQQVAGQVTVAQLQTQYETNNATLQADVASQVAQLSAQTQQVVSTLQAQVADTQSNNQLQAINIATQGEVAVASLPYATQIQLAQIAAGSGASDAQIQQLQDEISSNYIFFNTITNSLQSGQRQTDTTLAQLTYNMPSNQGQIPVTLPAGTQILANTGNASVLPGPGV